MAFEIIGSTAFNQRCFFIGLLLFVRQAAGAETRREECHQTIKSHVVNKHENEKKKEKWLFCQFFAV